MEKKLRVIINDRIEKLVLPSGIPSTVEELQTILKENFGILEEFSLQYLDSEFEDYFTLHKTDQIKHKDTVKVVYAPKILLNLQQVDESVDISFGQQSECDSGSYAESSASNVESSASYAESSASNVESSAGTSSSTDTIILPRRRSTTERCQPWPKQFPIPQFSYETEMYLERADEDYRKNGTLLTASKVKADILEKLTNYIYIYSLSIKCTDM